MRLTKVHGKRPGFTVHEKGVGWDCYADNAQVTGYYLDASHTVGGWGMASLLGLNFLCFQVSLPGSQKYFPQDLKRIMLKERGAPGEYWAASITMTTPLHHNLKLYEATPRTGRTLFWVTTLLRHTPIGRSGGWGGRSSQLSSRQLMSQLFNYLTSHSTCTSISRMVSR